ncbi:MAG: hypothetical protein K9J37_14625 [Saprospiraceae bacterium]|nr:hypothetical protein [Saprospiraceae bacterium]MCF8251142.1 hypothetical protein [Saprospiraceae bacterium]MCF8281865.1 hypothetical protein [Bacteroidales bacterium]MCF8312954.1 hypothetical protein [Saprospiraceae bacterium]MCF8441401.1 hypothetical protein [Saprospiraceae bacterium]
MNVFPVVKWAENILEKEPGLPPAVRQKAGWLFEHREFLQDLACLRQMVTQLLSMLKRQGASTKSLNAAQGFLSKNIGGRLRQGAVHWQEDRGVPASVVLKNNGRRNGLFVLFGQNRNPFWQVQIRPQPRKPIRDY